jgi:hypothetical protein
MRMAIFFATFSAVAVAAAQDVFELVAPSGVRVAIREVRLGQYSDAGDAAAELLSVLFLRGYTVSGSDGSSVTPVTRSGLSTATAAASTVEANNTTVANTGTPAVLLADSFNVAAGFRYYPGRDDAIILQPSTRFVVRITAPADEITMNGTLVFDELGVDRYKPV